MQRRRELAPRAPEGHTKEGARTGGSCEHGGRSFGRTLSVALGLTLAILGCGVLGACAASSLPRSPDEPVLEEDGTTPWHSAGEPVAQADAPAAAPSEAPEAADARGQRLEELPQEELPTTQDLEWHVVSQQPRIYVKDNFLSPDECEFLRNLVDGRLEPAKVVQEAANKWDTQMQVRNNKQIWLTPEEEREIPVLRHIIKRMHRSARIPDDDAEALQIGRYDVGEKYELHLDTDPKNEVPRPATMIVYLHESEAGGETMFPIAPGSRDECIGWNTLPNGTQAYGIQNCCSEDHPGRLKIPPKLGRAVLFWNHDLAGNKDPQAEHAACPVLQGQKWIAQRWFRFDPYAQIVHPPDDRFDGLPPLAASSGRGAGAPESLPGRLDVRVLSQKDPRVYLIEDLLSQDECDHLIAVAQATSTFEENGIQRRWLSPEAEAADPIIRAVLKRFHRAALVPEAQGESLQLGHVPAGASSWLHLDSWPEGNLVRPLTLLVYLDGDGTSGSEGATLFPMGRCKEAQDCCAMARERGYRDGGPLAIPPKAGRAVLFASHRLDGKLDQFSVHGSCPAGPHGKWVAQRWFRTGRQNQNDYGTDPRFEGLGILRK